jgi:hypothetical protein
MITVCAKVSVTVVVFEMVFAEYRVDEPRAATRASNMMIIMIMATVSFLMPRRVSLRGVKFYS